MRINRTGLYGITAALALIGSLSVPTAAHAASVSCNSTVSRQSTSDPNAFGPIPSASGSTNCVLGVGNNSSAVGALQRTLNRCFAAGLTVDNDFGPRTKAALQNAQSIVGTTADGVYGPNTRNAFNSSTNRRWRVVDDFGRERCHSVFL